MEHAKEAIHTDFVFNDLEVMSTICGTNNENIAVMESLLKNPIYHKGIYLRYISQEEESIEDFKHMCSVLLDSHKKGIEINTDFIKTVYKQLTGNSDVSSTSTIRFQEERSGDTPRTEGDTTRDIPMISIPITEKKVVPRTKGQEEIFNSLQNNLLSFLVGPAGTGKTYLATAFALSQVLSKKKKKYIITRPVVEAGEKLGFLPGDLEQKILPFLRPIYDVLYELAGEALIRHFQDNQQLEIAPLAYMRGRTLKDAVVLLDEAQNCTPAQMRMFLTRMGKGSIAIVNGDISQSDIRVTNGLEEASRIFANVPHVGVVYLSNKDVQRSKLARIVINAYEKNQNNEIQEQ